MAYKYKVTLTYYYYGYPQAQAVYKIESTHFTGKLVHWGNQGWELPEIEPTGRKCNGYYWSLRTFLRDFYASHNIFDSKTRGMRTGQSVEFTLGD